MTQQISLIPNQNHLSESDIILPLLPLTSRILPHIEIELIVPSHLKKQRSCPHMLSALTPQLFQQIELRERRIANSRSPWCKCRISLGGTLGIGKDTQPEFGALVDTRHSWSEIFGSLGCRRTSFRGKESRLEYISQRITARTLFPPKFQTLWISLPLPFSIK